MEANLVHGPGDVQGRPLRLPAYAKRYLYRLYLVDPQTQRRIVRRALLGVAKGNAKTELMAAVALCELAGPVAPHAPEVRIAAASFEQADILYGTARAMIEEGPLRDRFHVFDTELRPKEQPGVLKRIAAAAGTTDGGRTTCFIADELHEWIGPRARVHLVNSNALSKRSVGLELNISTAGAERDSLLGRLYDYGRRVASGEVVDPEYLFEWWEADSGWDLSDPEQLVAAVREANPATDDWLDPERVARRYADPEVPEHEFRRYYLNQWQPAPSRWIDPPLWTPLAEPREVPAGAPIVIGFDGSSSRDNTALVAASLSDPPYLWLLGLWEPGHGEVQVPREAVYARLAEAIEHWDVRLIACDPAGWTTEIQDWAADWGEDRVIVVPQTAERMAPAADRFRALVVSGGLRHDGSPALARQIANAVTRETRWGLSIRKDGPNSPRKIDAAIAAILALTARDLAPAPPKRRVGAFLA